MTTHYNVLLLFIGISFTVYFKQHYHKSRLFFFQIRENPLLSDSI